MEQEKYNEAIFWFKLATEVPMATESPFHSPASYMATLFTNVYLL